VVGWTHDGSSELAHELPEPSRGPKRRRRPLLCPDHGLRQLVRWDVDDRAVLAPPDPDALVGTQSRMRYDPESRLPELSLIQREEPGPVRVNGYPLLSVSVTACKPQSISAHSRSSAGLRPRLSKKQSDGLLNAQTPVCTSRIPAS
jgi:hypothetical protein